MRIVARFRGNTVAARTVFHRVHAAWAAEHRRYHTVEHLVDCLRDVDRSSAPPDLADRAELALWYHDVIYEPYAHDNEERSAQLLEQDAQLMGIPSAVAAEAAGLVRATAHASGSPEQADAATDLVLDIDLSILGKDTLRFMDYEYAVEEEYAPPSIPAFRTARGRFLASMLARPHIFRSEAFRARYETPARAQLAALLAGPRYHDYR